MNKKGVPKVSIVFLLVITIFLFVLLFTNVFASTPGDINSCQDLDTAGTYTLTANVQAERCFNISADNIVLDCQSYIINYSVLTGGEAINNPGGYDNLTVRNCYLNNINNSCGGAGILLKNSKGHHLENITINSTDIADHSGIYFYSINDTIFINLTIIGDTLVTAGTRHINIDGVNNNITFTNVSLLGDGRNSIVGSSGYSENIKFYSLFCDFGSHRGLEFWNGTYFFYNSDFTTEALIKLRDNATLYIINTSLSSTDTFTDFLGGGAAYKKWWTGVAVNHTGDNSPVVNVNVIARNKNNNIIFNILTNSQGLVRQPLTEYRRNGTFNGENPSNYYFSNYTINGTKNEVWSNTTEQVNITTNFIDNNKIQLWIEGGGNLTTIENVTVPAAPTYSDGVYINVTINTSGTTLSYVNFSIYNSTGWVYEDVNGTKQTGEDWTINSTWYSDSFIINKTGTWNWSWVAANTVSESLTGEGTFVITPPLTEGCNNGTYNYTCGDTVISSCTMNADLEASGTCFEIGANDVTIDGAGYKINYSNSEAGYAINNTGFDNITIKNCIINQTSFQTGSYGIYYKDTENGTIENNTILPLRESSYAIYLDSSLGNIISNNTFIAKGLYIYDHSNNNIIENNNITTESDGIYFYIKSDNNIINNNTITTSEAGSDGIFLGANLHTNTTVSNNTITTFGGSAYGMRLDGGFYYSYINNNNITTSGNFAYGIYMSGDNNFFINNTISTNGHQSHGINIRSNTDNNTINNNTIKTSGSYSRGIHIYSSSKNSFSSDNITTLESNSHGIYLHSSIDTIIKDSIINTSYFNAADVYLSGTGINNFTNVIFNKSKVSFYSGTTSSINVHWYLDAAANYSDGLPVDDGDILAYNINNTFYFNATTNANGTITRQTVLEYMQNSTQKYMKTDYLLKATDGRKWSDLVQVNLTTNFIDNNKVQLTLEFLKGCDNGTYNYTCGETVISSCVMNNNISCNGNGFIIGADDVIIDGAGYIINYSVISVGTGINNTGFDNVTVKNCLINQMGTLEEANAIYYRNTINGTVENNTITTFGKCSDGIYFHKYGTGCFSNHSIISNNTITTTGKWGTGIWLSASYNNIISNNKVNRINYYGNNSGTGYGIYLYSFADSNNVSNNTITSTGGYTKNIMVYSDDNIISNNSIVSTGKYDIGIFITGDNNSLSNLNINLTNRLAYYGLQFWTCLNNNIDDFVITMNESIYSGKSAIRFHNSSNNSIKNGNISINVPTSISIRGFGINNLTNVSFNKSNVAFSGYEITPGSINVQWYLDAAANYSDSSPVDGGDILAYDINNTLYFNATTSIDGAITRQTVLEYMQNSTQKYYKTNYSLSATNGTLWSDPTQVDLTTNYIDNDKIQLTLMLGASIVFVDPRTKWIPMTTGETKTENYTIQNVGEDLYYCYFNSSDSLYDYITYNISNFNLSAGEVKDAQLTVTTPPEGYYEEVLNVTCNTSINDQVSSSNHPVLLVTVSSTPPGPNGGGGAEAPYVCLEYNWTAQTDRGKSSYQSYITPGGKRTLVLYLSNAGVEEVDITISCYDGSENLSQGICEYVSFSQTQFTLPTQAQYQERVDIIIDLKDSEFEEGEALFSVKITDNKACTAYFPVTLLISVWGKFFDPIGFLSQNWIISISEDDPTKEDIKIPYWSILMVAFIIFMLIGWWVFTHFRISPAYLYGFVTAIFIDFIIFIFL